jgi:hypothetical protein
MINHETTHSMDLTLTEELYEIERSITDACLILLLNGCSSPKNEVNDSLQLKDSLCNSVELGKYGIGFCDTPTYISAIQFDFLPADGSSYSQYDYKGPNPLFLQIWYPMEQNDLKPTLFIYLNITHKLKTF